MLKGLVELAVLSLILRRSPLPEVAWTPECHTTLSFDAPWSKHKIRSGVTPRSWVIVPLLATPVSLWISKPGVAPLTQFQEINFSVLSLKPPAPVSRPKPLVTPRSSTLFASVTSEARASVFTYLVAPRTVSNNLCPSVWSRFLIQTRSGSIDELPPNVSS